MLRRNFLAGLASLLGLTPSAARSSVPKSLLAPEPKRLANNLTPASMYADWTPTVFAPIGIDSDSITYDQGATVTIPGHGTFPIPDRCATTFDLPRSMSVMVREKESDPFETFSSSRFFPFDEQAG